MKVSNMTSARGNKVPNQFIITDGDNTYFQSYRVIVGKANSNNGKLWLDEHYWDYSTTTGKYRNQFTGMDKRETEKAIKSGDIILTNLN